MGLAGSGCLAAQDEAALGLSSNSQWRCSEHQVFIPSAHLPCPSPFFYLNILFIVNVNTHSSSNDAIDLRHNTLNFFIADFMLLYEFAFKMPPPDYLVKFLMIVGFFILFALMVFATFNDIVR